MNNLLLAQTSIPIQASTDILQSSLDVMTSTQQTWDEIWEATLSGGSSSSVSVPYFMLNQVAKFIAVAVILYFLFTWGGKMARSNSLQITLPQLLVVIGILALLQGNGESMSHLTLGLRGVINHWRNGMLTMQIADVQVGAAIQDQLMTDSARNFLIQKLQVCEAMPAPSVSLPSPTRPSDPDPPLTQEQQQLYLKMECYQSVRETATTLKAEYEAQHCTAIPGVQQVCLAFTRFMDSFMESMDDTLAAEWDKILHGNFAIADDTILSLRDFTLGTLASLGVKYFLNALQWVFTNLFEMAFWLSAITAPIMLALSLAPAANRGMLPIVDWVITFFSIGLMQIYYVALIGIMAVLMAKVDTAFLSDLRFPLMLGVFAPLIAFALARGGALAAARGLGNAGAQTLTSMLFLGAGPAGAVVGNTATTPARVSVRSRS